MSGTEDSPGVGTWTVEIWTDGMGYPTRRNAVAELFALGKFRGGIGHQVLSQHPERESTTGRTRFRTVAAKKLREATGRPRPRDAFAGAAAGLAYLLAPRCAPPRMEATTATTLRPDIAAELGNLPTVGMLDEAALLAKNAFVIPPDELIALAKAFTAAQLAGTADGTGGVDWFASDFRFVAPVVGPFDKSEFVDSLKSFERRPSRR
eukprot:scaffold45026_cov72-Phaeocystis_antarctica.AAC.5